LNLNKSKMILNLLFWLDMDINSINLDKLEVFGSVSSGSCHSSGLSVFSGVSYINYC